ncbi:TRBP2 protein, partial [Chaetorhynchus papuensis]|nr:TRBP2 protein [Chaetorhynchus papuensis]
SLEQMVAASPGKTPISLLQEYGTRLGRTPGYDLLKAEGQAHQPNFTFRVTLGDISCTGGSPPRTPGDPLPLGQPHSQPGPPLYPHLGTVIPALGWLSLFWGQLCPFWGWLSPFGAGCLRFAARSPFRGADGRRGAAPCQELVVQKGWRLPEYTVTQESGPAHRKEFTMTCRVERFVEIGSGTSKKLAKRNAAAKMLVRIHNVPMEPRDGSEAEGEEDQFNMTCPRLEGLRGRAPGCTWDSLRNSAGEKLGQLR